MRDPGERCRVVRAGRDGIEQLAVDVDLANGHRKAKIITGIQAVTDWVASMFQSEEPCPCWKTNTTIPKAATSESRFSSTALIASTIERNARVSRISVTIIKRASA
jgi:hypothetical protein